MHCDLKVSFYGNAKKVSFYGNEQGPGGTASRGNIIHYQSITGVEWPTSVRKYGNTRGGEVRD